MNRDEAAVGEWLGSQGRAVRHLGRGEDPPDIVVDGNVAVEVTTIASYARQTLWDFMNGVCKSLGPAEHGRGYWMEVVSDDEALLQGNDKEKIAAIKGDLRRSAKVELRRHYANPPATGAEAPAADGFPIDGRILLPHGVELVPSGRINCNRDDLKYKIFTVGEPEGALVVPCLADSIQAAIRKKTAKPSIKERARGYAEWWLAVTDPHHYAASLNDDEIRAVASAIDYGPPWRRVILVCLASDHVCQVINLTKAGSQVRR